MTAKEREKFRRSKPWLDFRAKCRLKTNVDYITKEPLVKLWNLHHLDLRVANYSDLSDMRKFVPLNPKTHDLVHLLYKIYKKDKHVLDRLKDILDKMEEYTNDKKRTD